MLSLSVIDPKYEFCIDMKLYVENLGLYKFMCLTNKESIIACLQEWFVTPIDKFNHCNSC